MRTKVSFGGLLLILASLFVLQACNDDEGIRLTRDVGYDDILTHRESVNEITLTNTTSVGLYIEGGEAPYNVTSRDANVAQASIIDDNLRVDGVSVGTTEIIVSDSHQEFTVLQVSVAQASNTLDITKTGVRIEGIAQEEDAELYEEITQAVMALSRYTADMQLVLNHERSESMLKGELLVYTNPTEEPQQGRFKYAYNEESGTREFHFDWGGRTDVLNIYTPTPEESREAGPLQITLVQDLTEELKNRHPEYSQVIRAEQGIVITVFP